MGKDEFRHFVKFWGKYDQKNHLRLRKFQRSLFLEITTLVTWLKSTLLVKNKCFDKHIYMKTQCLQTNKIQNSLERETGSRVGKEKRVALIKSSIDVW